LDLDVTAITDSGMIHLHSLPQLRELDLAHTQVTDAALASFPKRMQNRI
jgi:hypothetical protein